MRQIYADFNDIGADGTLPLMCRGSVDSIAALRGPLHDGEDVVLSDGELQVVARLFRRHDGSWEARSSWAFCPIAPAQDLSDEILLEDVTGLCDLPPSDRASKIADLGRRVARGACDDLVIERIVEIASSESDLGARKAWLGYFSASGAEAFLPILEAWFGNADEEGRVGVVGVLAWNKSPQTNEVLLRLICLDESKLVRQLALKYLVRRGSLGRWQPCDLLSIVPESDWRPVTKKEYFKLIESLPKKEVWDRRGLDRESFLLRPTAQRLTGKS